jgi:hypothetical protein
VRPIRFSFQPQEADYIELVGVADLHFGHAQHQHYKAMKHRDYIAASPDRYAIDLGDPIENALKDSPGSIYDQRMRPRDQREYAYDWYEPISDRLLGICASNHGERSVRTADFSPEEWLADKFNVQYIRFQAVLAITVGDSRKGNQYLIHVQHGGGGAQTVGGIILKMQKTSIKTQGCHAYLRAHNHQWVHHPQTTFWPDARHGKIRKIVQHLVCSGAHLDYDESYAEGKDYPLPTEGQVSLKLYRDRPCVEVTRLTY